MNPPVPITTSGLNSFKIFFASETECKVWIPCLIVDNLNDLDNP